MKLRDILSLEVENYSSETHDYTEHTLRAKCDPWSLIQLLAFDGRAHDRNGNVLHIRDWDTMRPEVLAEIRETTFISFPAVLKGTRKPEADGSYIFKSVGVNATVEHGMISIPNPQQVKANARNLKKRTLL